MSKPEFVSVMVYISAATGKEISEETARVYFDLLGDLPVDVLQMAAKRVVLEHPWATFPSAAELRQAAVEILQGRISEISPAEAWQLAWEATGKIDPEVNGSIETACAKLPPIVFDAMKTFGINALCYGRDPIGVVRGQFMTIFEQLAARDRRQALFPVRLQESILARLPKPVAGALTEIGKMQDQEAGAVVPRHNAV
jgi:hypothetical protein